MADANNQGTEDTLSFASANKEYPLAPEGIHKVTVKRALFQMRENSFKPEAGKQPTINLMLVSDQTYEDETTGEKRNYTLFKTMKISDHEKATLPEYFKSVMGMDIELNDKKQIVLRRLIEKKEDGEDAVHFPQFEGQTFSVLVKHKKGDDGDMRDRVDSFVPGTAEEKAFNAAIFRAPAA